MMPITDEQIQAARRDLIRSLTLLAWPADGVASLAARNIDYHAHELLKALDAFYAGREPDEEAGEG